MPPIFFLPGGNIIKKICLKLMGKYLSAQNPIIIKVIQINIEQTKKLISL